MVTISWNKSGSVVSSGNQRLVFYLYMRNYLQCLCAQFLHFTSHLTFRSLYAYVTYINTIIELLTIIHRHCLLFRMKSFGDWILSPSSGRSLLSWVRMQDGDSIQSPKLFILNRKNRTMDNVQKNSIIVLIHRRHRLSVLKLNFGGN
jgi:hypothetical protein